MAVDTKDARTDCVIGERGRGRRGVLMKANVLPVVCCFVAVPCGILSTTAPLFFFC